MGDNFNSDGQGRAEDRRFAAPSITTSFVLRDYLKRQLEFIEILLRDLVPQPDDGAARLQDAMRYSLLAGGKRLRPTLALASCEAVGGRAEAAVGLACAVEMIHTYSMIHDDLPCMDDDDLRRGKPANHKMFGEAMAVLAGDALLTDAFGVLASKTSDAVPRSLLVETVIELAQAVGSGGMVAGQAMDMSSEGRETGLCELESLHERKTGALFLAAIRGGARLGGGASEQIEKLTAYGRALGLSFQIVDDILDVESSTEKMGKLTQKDDARGKATYPAILGLKRSHEFARELRDRAITALCNFGPSAEPLRALANFVVERTL